MWRIFSTVRWIIIVSIVVGAYQGYRAIIGLTDSDAALRRSMAAEITRRAVHSLPIPAGRPTIYVAPTLGDYQGIVGDHLRQWVERQNAIVISNDQPSWEVATRFEWADHWVPSQLAGKAFQERFDYQLDSRVQAWVTDPPEDRRLELDIRLVDFENDRLIYERAFKHAKDNDSVVSRESRDSAHSQDVSGSPPMTRRFGERFFLLLSVWLTAGVLMPWLAASVIKRTLRSDSNAASTALAAAYILSMAVLTWFLWAGSGSSLLTRGVMFCLSLAWLGYLELVCRVLDRWFEIR